MTRSREPIWWFLFAAGGTVAALLVPILIVITGIAGPAGWLGEALAYERLLPLVSYPITRLFLFVVISLPLYHWAHRFRFTLFDLGLKSGRRLVAFITYGSAVIGTLLTAYILISF